MLGFRHAGKSLCFQFLDRVGQGGIGARASGQGATGFFLGNQIGDLWILLESLRREGIERVINTADRNGCFFLGGDIEFLADGRRDFIQLRGEGIRIFFKRIHQLLVGGIEDCLSGGCLFCCRSRLRTV